MTLAHQGIDEFPLGVGRKTLADGFSEHDHDYIEINVIVRGTARHIVNGRPQPIRTGDAFVLNPGTIHGFADTDNLSFYQLMFDPMLIASSLPALKKISGYHALFILEPAALSSNIPFRSFTTLDMKGLEAVVLQFEAMIREQDCRREGYQAALQAMLLQLVTTLSRLYSGAGVRQGVIPRAARAAAFIERNYLTPVSLRQLASEAGCSESQLIRDFRQGYGTTPVNYLLHLRLENAIQLLRNRSLSITDVAYSCGFSDSNYFTRLFKQHTGHTPSRFRKDTAE